MESKARKVGAYDSWKRLFYLSICSAPASCAGIGWTCLLAFPFLSLVLSLITTAKKKKKKKKNARTHSHPFFAVIQTATTGLFLLSLSLFYSNKASVRIGNFYFCLITISYISKLLLILFIYEGYLVGCMYHVWRRWSCCNLYCIVWLSLCEMSCPLLVMELRSCIALLEFSTSLSGACLLSVPITGFNY